MKASFESIFQETCKNEKMWPSWIDEFISNVGDSEIPLLVVLGNKADIPEKEHKV